MVLTMTAVSIAVMAALGIATATKYAAERVVAKRIEEVSRLVNLPRRDRESVYAWNKRVVPALNELMAANQEFVTAAMREGTITPLNGRASVWSLPAEHPAAIRLAKARNEPVDVVEAP
jgi:hypothetical protein